MKLNQNGLLIVLSGPSGVGKTMYTKKFLDKKAEKDNSAYSTPVLL